MNVDYPTLNTISLCSGVGMLDEGFHAGLRHMGIRSSTILYAEREAYPVSVLEARMEEGSIHPAPIWFGDFTELPARDFRGVVDCVVAGFPCQDLSVAGRRAGLYGKRSGLFFEVVRIATDCGAWLMLLENVAGIATATASVVDTEEGDLDERAASRVVGELADLGWDAEWIVISASDVGASHGRARWFCIAWRMADTEHVASIERFGVDVQRGRQGQTEQAWLGSSGIPRKEELDNSVCLGRGARRMPDGEHDGDIATAASEIAVVNPSSTGLQERGLSAERELPAEAGAGIHDRFELSGAQLADTCGTRSASGIPRQNTGDEGDASLAIHRGDGHQLADTDRAGLEGGEFGRGDDSSGGAAEWIN